MRNKTITSFFCLLLAVSALIGLLMPDRYYSEREKRTLTQKPKFTVANFISGEFSSELEKYLTDQVPHFRRRYAGNLSFPTLSTIIILRLPLRRQGSRVGVFPCGLFRNRNIRSVSHQCFSVRESIWIG